MTDYENERIQDADGRIDLDAMHRQWPSSLDRYWGPDEWKDIIMNYAEYEKNTIHEFGTPKRTIHKYVRNTITGQLDHLYQTLFRWSFKPTTWLSPDDGCWTLHIDKLIATDDKYVIAELITTRIRGRPYEEWASNWRRWNSKNASWKGLYVDILESVENADVRFAVVKKYPERTLAYIKSLDGDEQRHLGGFQVLMYQKQPDIKALKFLFSLNWRNRL